MTSQITLKVSMLLTRPLHDPTNQVTREIVTTPKCWEQNWSKKLTVIFYFCFHKKSSWTRCIISLLKLLDINLHLFLPPLSFLTNAICYSRIKFQKQLRILSLQNVKILKPWYYVLVRLETSPSALRKKFGISGITWISVRAWGTHQNFQKSTSERGTSY